MDQDLLPTPSQLNFVGDFDAQVKELMESIRLSRNEVENLKLLFCQLERTLQRAWRGCKVQPFGSIVTGLGIKSSDVDIYIEIPEHLKCSDSLYVMEARNILRRQPMLFRNAFAITTAKVPIVKFYHVPTGRNCDVSFKSPSGVRNSQLIACLLQSHPQALPLAIMIKYWSKVHQLTGTNLVPNYALTMMVIFYLQQIDLVPCVAAMQTNSWPFIVDDWNTAFEPLNHKTENNDTFYEIVGGFFKFYSTFKFDDYVISPFAGRPILRSLFKTPESVPEEFVLYKDNLSRDICQPLKIDTKICVQDPFEHNRNCTASVHLRLALTLISHFQLGAKVYEECSSRVFLKELFERKPPPIKLNRPQSAGKGPSTSKPVAARPNNTAHIATHKNNINKPKNKNRRTFHNNVELLFKQYVHAKKGKR